MKVNSTHVTELRYFLTSIELLLNTISLEKPLFKEGTTYGQVVFHTAESADYWMRAIILNQTRERDRDSEFTRTHSEKEIKHSLHQALLASDDLINKNILLNTKLKNPITINPGRFEINTVYEAIIHTTSHTAEHFGQLSL